VIKNINKTYIYFKKEILFTKIIKVFSPYFLGLFYFFTLKNNKKIKLQINVKKNKLLDEALCRRIFKSFKKMKNDQKKNSFNKPSKQWQTHLKNDFKELDESFKFDDFQKFQKFLNNFGNHGKYLGIENQIYLKKFNKNIFLKKYLVHRVFKKQYDLWNFHNSLKKSSSNLKTPRFGNQIGANIDNNFVTLASFSNEVISSNLNELLKSDTKPCIAELGAGYGQLAFHLLKKKKNFCYIDFDIPEVLCLAAYYLIKSFPKKKSVLYGEKKFTKKNIFNSQLIFLPYYEIQKLTKNSIDLFINICSLGEMEKPSVKQYCKFINKSSNFFFHMNHDVYRNKFSKNKSGFLSNEYPIGKNFTLTSKYLDIFHFVYLDGNIHFEHDIFACLYKKNFN
jgi:putative sugar O-methyltransferase